MDEDRKRIIAELGHIQCYFEGKAAISHMNLLFLNWAHVAKDAAETLKTQGPKAVTLEGKEDWYGVTAFCPYCNVNWMPGDLNEIHFCPNCGKAVCCDEVD